MKDQNLLTPAEIVGRLSEGCALAILRAYDTTLLVGVSLPVQAAGLNARVSSGLKSPLAWAEWRTETIHVRCQ